MPCIDAYTHKFSVPDTCYHEEIGPDTYSIVGADSYPNEHAMSGSEACTQVGTDRDTYRRKLLSPDTYNRELSGPDAYTLEGIRPDTYRFELFTPDN